MTKAPGAQSSGGPEGGQGNAGRQIDKSSHNVRSDIGRPNNAQTIAHTIAQTNAAKIVAAGGLIVAPTETVYAVLADATKPGALARLNDLQERVAVAQAELLNAATPAPIPRPWTWHSPDPEAILRVFSLTAPAHRRIVRTLLPGPVRLLIETEPQQAERIRATLGVPAGIIDDDGLFAARVPDQSTLLGVLHAACDAGACTIVGVNSRAVGLSVDSGGALVEDAAELAKAMGIDAVLDSGPTLYRKRSSGVRLLRDGEWRVEHEGAVDERWIRKRLEHSVLIVCTGNTCRSPMAQAIARHEIAQGALGDASPIPVRVESAGVAATPGAPMTREAREALSQMGIEADKHASRGVTKDLVQQADTIYVLTRSHAAQLLELVPEAKGKVEILDPAGSDVPDPFGGSLSDYTKTASIIRSHLRTRLQQLRASLSA